MIKQKYGFTLVEILVAMLVFSVVAILAYGGLRNVLASNEYIENKTQILSQYQSLFSVIKNDLEQSIEREVRDQLGTVELSFVSLPKKDGALLSFSTQIRSSWQLKNGVSNIQRIEYDYQNGQFIRYSWNQLDRSHDAEPKKQVLLENIKNIELDFINKTSHEFWPLPKDHDDFAVLPRAVKLMLEIEPGVEVHRLFLIRA